MKHVVSVMAHLWDFLQLKLYVISRGRSPVEALRDVRVVRIIRTIPFNELHALRRSVSDRSGVRRLAFV